MKRRKTIGVLGGMGPVASAETYMQIIRICQRKYGAIEDIDFPEIFIYSLPLEGFDSVGFHTKDRTRILKQLITALQKLETAGADMIIIDCNTVHYFYEELQKNLAPKILNLIEITAAYVQKNHIRTVGVLSSRTSKRVGLYEKALKNVGVHSIDTTDAEQRLLDKAILAVMADKVSYEECAAVNNVIERMFRAGADAIILGCTEISYLLKERVDANRYIDSQSLAIHHAVAEWHKTTL